MSTQARAPRECPDLGGKKCRGEKCEAWDENEVDVREGERVVTKWVGGCTKYFWQPIQLREITVRLHGMQKAVEELRNSEALDRISLGDPNSARIIHAAGGNGKDDDAPGGRLPG